MTWGCQEESFALCSSCIHVVFLDDDTEFVMQAREVQYKNLTRLMDLHLEIGYKVKAGRKTISLQEKRKDYYLFSQSHSLIGCFSSAIE